MKKKSLALLMAVVMLFGVTVGGTIAWLIAESEEVTNTFTVGKISIDLQEPEWVPPTEIVPQQEFKKDPQIKNDGLNDAFVFLKVTVPYDNVVTANEDGSKNDAKDTELFTYDVKEGWTELVSKQVKDSNAKTITHLYAYTGGQPSTMESLAVNASTPKLFDYVRFANIVEDQQIEAATLNIVVDAFAIQTTNLNDGKTTFDGDNSDGTVTPMEVWSILEKQSPSLEVSANEEIHTDIKK